MSKYEDAIRIAQEKGYTVDKDGNVFYKGKQRKLQYKSNKEQIKYYKFNIRNNDTIYTIKVHQLQAYQKYGEKMFEDDMVVRHLNCNSLDNSYDNIAIGTASDNMMDIPEDIRKKNAIYATSFTSKFNHQEVYDFYKKTKIYKQTMDKFGIKSKGTITWIRKKFE